MKKLIIFTVVAGSLLIGAQANAQCFARRGCFARRSSAAAYQYQWGAARYATRYSTQCALDVCGTSAPPSACGACAAVSEAAACEAVDVPKPCAPVGVVGGEEYIPTAEQTAEECSGGFCWIRRETAKTTSQSETVAEVYLREINATRARHGLAALSLDVNLTAGCVAHSQRQAQRGAIYHANGAGFEIVAQNWGGGIAEALRQWIASPAHASLLLSPSFRSCGVATVRTSDGRNFCTMRFN